MDIPKEYATLIINTQEPQGQSVYALADSLFRKLNKIMTAKSPSVSVSIHPVALDSQQNPSCSIRLSYLGVVLVGKRTQNKKFSTP